MVFMLQANINKNGLFKTQKTNGNMVSNGGSKTRKSWQDVMKEETEVVKVFK